MKKTMVLCFLIVAVFLASCQVGAAPTPTPAVSTPDAVSHLVRLVVEHDASLDIYDYLVDALETVVLESQDEASHQLVANRAAFATGWYGAAVEDLKETEVPVELEEVTESFIRYYSLMGLFAERLWEAADEDFEDCTLLEQAIEALDQADVAHDEALSRLERELEWFEEEIEEWL